ncbi:hypothetical protein [Sulfuracidifex tepidarius]|uniref:Uncharacterized protein n=1 Tax=Sulfuracidifex tepidarius TaxID=1294262 RepID=A0A510DZR8_9CREN|nr:hypothetical protein [Sulfuracidifex tepidarius]BBG25440.1 hypothetical protein IC006_2776 [Sulfuracidifex tepidarius]BBG28234.1 hypothetical protein IC007_2790 [Sulfuracidifex tepidarius]
MRSKVADVPLMGDKYTITNDKDGLRFINSSGEAVNPSLLEVGNEIGDEIVKNRSLYYKLLPLSKYPDIVTFKLIDSIINIGGFADDMLEASCKKGENYCRYAMSKIKEAKIPLFKISDPTLEMIYKIDRSILFLYHDIKQVYKIDPNLAFEIITSKHELSLSDLVVLLRMGKLKDVLEESVIHVDQNFPSRYVILLNTLLVKNKDAVDVISSLPFVRISECSFVHPEATDFLQMYSEDFRKMLNEKGIVFLTDINKGITTNRNEINIDLTDFLRENNIIILKQAKTCES